jgi:hypothetical protein
MPPKCSLTPFPPERERQKSSARISADSKAARCTGICAVTKGKFPGSPWGDASPFMEIRNFGKYCGKAFREHQRGRPARSLPIPPVSHDNHFPTCTIDPSREVSKENAELSEFLFSMRSLKNLRRKASFLRSPCYIYIVTQSWNFAKRGNYGAQVFYRDLRMPDE